jgi:putative nucleotidyltransferase with HDIG domain
VAEIHAAGFVLYRRETGRNRYLTLRNARHGDVGLPKGRGDEGESPLATALRETEEETGLGRDRLAPHRWFERAITYPVAHGSKEVVYLAARAEGAEVRLSPEHDGSAWLDLDEALAAIRHENLRGVLREAATFLKDPILRRGLTPAEARRLLAGRVSAKAPVVAHAAEVASMARILAEAWGETDVDYVEAAAWLHDIGRARTQGAEHALAGFELLVAEGLPGYAPPCLSHYCKGAARTEMGGDPDLLRAMWRACDLETFETEERLIALADFMAAGDRRVTLEERHADLCARYGPSPFFDRMLAIARGLKHAFESRTGHKLYELCHGR